jgi:hypothetical protein
VPGPSGDACAACRAPLAPDQRYCLHCGERRGPPRIDPVAHARDNEPAPEQVPAETGSVWPLPSPRVAGIATLLVLGFGIVAGAAAGPKTQPAATPARAVVVVAQAPAPAPAPSPAPIEHPAPRPKPNPTPQAQPSQPEPSQPASSPATSPTKPDEPSSNDTPATTKPKATLKHVWVVALTGHTMGEALADPSPMPYLAGTLRPKGRLLSQYNPHLPGGLANLIGLISGQRPTAEQRGNCPAYNDVDLQARTGCVFAKDVDTLPGQLTAVGKTWRGYVEDADAGQPPDTCRHPAPGGPLEPVMARNPLLFFHAIVDGDGCAPNIAGMSRLVPDTEDPESAPTFSLVIPNACHDAADQPCAPGVPAGLGAADAWLKEQLDPLLASKAYKDGGLVVVTFDTGPDVTKPLGALMLSDAVQAGGTDDGDYRPANLLRTFDDGFGLDPLGRAKDVDPVAITKPSR